MMKHHRLSPYLFLNGALVWTIFCIFLFYFVQDTSKTITDNQQLLAGPGDNTSHRQNHHLTTKKSNNSIGFPKSIKYENDFQTIEHPGDPKESLSVPKFYTAPAGLDPKQHDIKVYRKLEELSQYNGMDTINIAIASYRDWQCTTTVQSIFKKAKYPERVRVAVTDQLTEEETPCATPSLPCSQDPTQLLCKYKNQIDVYEMEAKLATGPCLARHINHRMYRGETFHMQIDAHITFVKDWDVSIIEQWKSAKNEMAVLTTYLTDVEGSLDGDGNSTRNTRPIMCNTHYESNNQGTFLRHQSQPEGFPSIKGEPQLEPYWAAGFSFGKGHFVMNVPYDQYLPMIFLGEEMSIGLRGFTYGYDFYAAEKSICFHSYAKGVQEESRAKVPHFWEHSNLYQGVGQRAMNRVLGIVKMIPEVDPSEWDHTEEDKYGIGSVRTVEQFYDIFGIDVVKKYANPNLCNFVDGGLMHKKFKHALRKDMLGLDYSKIKYKIDNDPAML